MSAASWLDETRTWAERELERALPEKSAFPARLHEAMRYAMLRPAGSVCGRRSLR